MSAQRRHTRSSLQGGWWAGAWPVTSSRPCAAPFAAIRYGGATVRITTLALDAAFDAPCAQWVTLAWRSRTSPWRPHLHRAPRPPTHPTHPPSPQGERNVRESYPQEGGHRQDGREVSVSGKRYRVLCAGVLSPRSGKMVPRLTMTVMSAHAALEACMFSVGEFSLHSAERRRRRKRSGPRAAPCYITHAPAVRTLTLVITLRMLASAHIRPFAAARALGASSRLTPAVVTRAFAGVPANAPGPMSFTLSAEQKEFQVRAVLHEVHTLRDTRERATPPGVFLRRARELVDRRSRRLSRAISPRRR